MKGWIIGNGPSRNEWDYRNLNGIVYGCNTLYEDCLSHDWQWIIWWYLIRGISSMW